MPVTDAAQLAYLRPGASAGASALVDLALGDAQDDEADDSPWAVRWEEFKEELRNQGLPGAARRGVELPSFFYSGVTDPLAVVTSPTPIPHPGVHTRYIGWSAVSSTDPGFDALASLQAGDDFPSDQLTPPSTLLAAGYLVIGVTAPPGFPTALYIDGNTTNQIALYTTEGVVADVLLVGVTHEVLVGLDELATVNVVGRTITLGY